MFYDTAFNGQNYNYFGYNKMLNAYNYALLLQQQQQQQQANMYHHTLHPQYDEMFASMRPNTATTYIPTSTGYLMDEFYQFNPGNLAQRLKRYKPSMNTLDRNDYISESLKKYHKHLVKQQHHAWKKATLDSNYKSTEYASTNANTPAPTKSAKKLKSKKAKMNANTTTYDTYSKYSTHYDLKSTLKTKTFKSDNGLLESKQTPKSVRGNLSHLISSSHHSGSEASKSRLTESSHSSSKSSDKLAILQPQLLQQQTPVVPPPPPPPPAPPLTEDLFKPVDNSFLFTRKKKIRKPLLIDADELASKSFDAVVDELKFKLEKLRTSDDNLSRFNTLLNRTIPKEIRPDSPKFKLINYSDNFKPNIKELAQSLLEKTQSNSSIYSQKLDSKSNKSIQMETVSKLSISSQYSGNNKKHIESYSSFDSMHDDGASSKKTNSVKFSTNINMTTNMTPNTTMNMSSKSSDEKRFKLEIYDSNGEESDDYTKYTRLKFTPTPKNETTKFIDDKINYTPNNEASNGKETKQFEFFTQNLFMVHNGKHKKNSHENESKIDQYRNEFKETARPLIAPFIKIVKTTLTNQGDKSFASLDGNLKLNGEVKSDTSSSGIDSANYLNSDDDLNQAHKSILKTNSIENFLIPSKFSSFTDYNLTKSKQNDKSSSKAEMLKEEEVVQENDAVQQFSKLNSQFEFNEYNKLCDQLNDFVSLQNNYFSAEFELSNDDNQMLNKYLNEMTNYYQNLNNQEFDQANFVQ